MVISSQDFRNIYEKFYNQLRLYLWPYQTLEQLAAVEENIYTTFINMEKLDNDFAKLESSIKDVCKEDEILGKLASDIRKMINAKDVSFYSRLYQVTEINPEKDKQIRTVPEREEEEI